MFKMIDNTDSSVIRVSQGFGSDGKHRITINSFGGIRYAHISDERRRKSVSMTVEALDDLVQVAPAIITASRDIPMKRGLKRSLSGKENHSPIKKRRVEPLRLLRCGNEYSVDKQQQQQLQSAQQESTTPVTSPMLQTLNLSSVESRPFQTFSVAQSIRPVMGVHPIQSFSANMNPHTRPIISTPSVASVMGTLPNQSFSANMNPHTRPIISTPSVASVMGTLPNQSFSANMNPHTRPIISTPSVTSVMGALPNQKCTSTQSGMITHSIPTVRTIARQPITGPSSTSATNQSVLYNLLTETPQSPLIDDNILDFLDLEEYN